MRELSLHEIEYVSGGDWWNDLVTSTETYVQQAVTWLNSFFAGGSNSTQLSAVQVQSMSTLCMQNGGSVSYNSQGQQQISGTIQPGSKTLGLTLTNTTGQTWTCTITPKN